MDANQDAQSALTVKKERYASVAGALDLARASVESRLYVKLRITCQSVSALRVSLETHFYGV